MKTDHQMRDYLENHFRYDTMNSWNAATSYARKVKLYLLDIPKEDMDTAYEVLSIAECPIWFEIRCIQEEFAACWNHRYQMGFNGRSNGYIVLYRGGVKASGYKTQCDTCDILTCYEKEQPCRVSGCNGTLLLLTHEHRQVFTYPGKGLDMGMIENVEESYAVVVDFNKTVDRIIKTFKEYIHYHRGVDEVRCVKKSVRVMKAI